MIHTSFEIILGQMMYFIVQRPRIAKRIGKENDLASNRYFAFTIATFLYSVSRTRLFLENYSAVEQSSDSYLGVMFENKDKLRRTLLPKRIDTEGLIEGEQNYLAFS